MWKGLCTIIWTVTPAPFGGRPIVSSILATLVESEVIEVKKAGQDQVSLQIFEL